MEGLGVGSGGVLWPCLATNTCENTGGSVLGFAKALRESRPDALVFIRGVCLNAAFPRSELLDLCRLPGATIGSLPASWRTGSPHGSYLPEAHGGHKGAMAVAFHSAAVREAATQKGESMCLLWMQRPQISARSARRICIPGYSVAACLVIFDA